MKHAPVVLSVLLELLGCGTREPAAAGSVSSNPTPPPSISSSSSLVAPSASATSPTPELAALDRALAGAGWGKVSRELSEKPGDFPSDNLISNETSLLQPAAALARREPGGAYVGVGPEQNFTYIALGRPQLAIIVDIRRDNLLLHALYRGLFVKGDDRLAFACHLFARRCDGQATSDEPEAILRQASKEPLDAARFDEVHGQLAALVGSWGLDLDPSDWKRLRALHKQFATSGPDLRFEMRQPSGRTYPTFVGLLSAEAAAPGEPRSFFASEAGYRLVRDLERRGRVVPVVGDFAGPTALRRSGALVRDNGLEVRTFYVSNVEQYLLAESKWRPWVDNLKSLPLAPDAVIVRGYLDQGRRHPKQWPGHRTATVVQPARLLLDRGHAKPYPSFFDAATDGVTR